ncbi:FAD-linked oxidoreductase [Laetiporus sulphureus 93-53]|uniref:Proline dehydrogenase n=1 Tax=Laetiporus sulphureus 93-53 TaxID=1314785 RepID=A0A165FHZ2_9APHY|nr:FAD-linked oxidoreductase [Laetiporus sulphureus 93-53]KZT08999.1 FAD-linked oxidoreductase [Laetiporus sulphureus 93-53]
MWLRLTCRRLISARTHAFSSGRSLSTSSRPIKPASRLSQIGLATGGILTASLLLENAVDTIHADAAHPDGKAQSERPPTPLSALIRAYIVYSMCSIPPLIDYAPSILSILSSVPGLKQITEAIVRVTFFDQFVGGDTAEDALPLLEELRAENKGCLFAYSVEVDEAEAAGTSREERQAEQSVHKRIVAETLHCIDVAADFEDEHSRNGKPDVQGRKTWVAIKLTAMLPRAETLYNFSRHLVASRPAASPPIPFPGRPLPTDFDVLLSTSPADGPLTSDDISDLRELFEDLRSIGRRAEERNVRIIVDAEHSWYQPAIDAFALSLQREFNKLPDRPRSFFRSSPPVEPAGAQPLIYQSYQAYLHRTPEYLKQSIEAARAGGYALGVKLVRGAYHPQELASYAAAHSASSASASHGSSHSVSPDPMPPVRLTKPDTDDCYNECAAMLLQQVRKDIDDEAPRIGVLFGTHNWRSCDLILNELLKLAIARKDETGAVTMPVETTERVTIGQLYGMCDDLTNSLVDRTRSDSPFVIKYIPYGALSEVMPYLSRRAIENKSVLGNGSAAEERKRASAEIWARLFG